jgi:signal transduction histidine kinase
MQATGSRLALKALVLGLGDPLSSPGERSSPGESAGVRDEALLRPLRLVLEDSDVTGFAPRKLWDPVKTTVTAVSEVAGSSFVIAELSQPDAGISFYLGLAHSLGKTILALKRYDAKAADRVFQVADFRLEYDDSFAGIEDLVKRFRASLDTIRRNIQLDHSVLLGRDEGAEKAIDWTHLSGDRFGDLCYELLLREGYVQLEWVGGGELDLMGFRPQADGIRELFFFSLGGGLSDLGTAEALSQDFQRLLPRALAGRDRMPLATTEGRLDINLYFLWSPGDSTFAIDKNVLTELAQRMGAAARLQQVPIQLRASWLDRRRLEALVAPHPVLLRKYFSGDAGDFAAAAPPAGQRRRKTLEDLYGEAIQLAEKAAEASANLEKKYGINPGLEWQERAYSVTHSIGNAIFPVETYLDMIREIFGELRDAEGAKMAELALESLEKAKVHIRKFKNIARLKLPQLERVEILPRLEASLHSAQAKKIRVDWYVGDHAAVFADPDLFDELVDELVANSISWLEQSAEKRIVVTLRTALPDDLSPHLQRKKASSRDPFTWIRFEDSGPGVPSELKEKIFELFYSTNPQGMGFGLSIVRKNLRDFGGDIIETGMPGQGARFDLFLPFARQR